MIFYEYDALSFILLFFLLVDLATSLLHGAAHSFH